MYSRLAHEQLLYFVYIATVTMTVTVTVTVTVSGASTETCPPEFTTENGTDVTAGNNITLDGLWDDMICKDGSQDMYLAVHKETSRSGGIVTIPANSSGWLDINCNITCLNSVHITMYNLSITVFVILSGRNTSVTTESTVSIPPIATTASEPPFIPSQPTSVTSPSPTTSGIYA